MSKVDLIMPKMGESIMEATIIKWLKKPGDPVTTDESILEIATDKVDSEIPSPVDGVISEILFEENEVVEVGTVIAVLESEAEEPDVIPSPAIEDKEELPDEGRQISQQPVPQEPVSQQPVVHSPKPEEETAKPKPQKISSHDATGKRFYSPLVRTMAKKEGVSMSELDSIEGTGAQGRVTKKDFVRYISTRSESNGRDQETQKTEKPTQEQKKEIPATSVSSASDEIIEMDRMRKMIADHMVRSKQTSPHVTSFVEADVTNVVHWRNSAKKEFRKKYGENFTFTPIFIHAVVEAIKEFPMVNISVDDDRIIRKKNIHIGMATALPSGNLIVPVIKHADQYNLTGLARQVNDLSARAREQNLKPEEIQGGTFTLTNVGTFGNVMGTPIINQPQVAILATGAIRKKPAVIETDYGDVIAIRHMMFLSLSYDHRVVDGFLGGSFLRKIADNLEQFDTDISV